jgi:hypothetical protein
MAPACIHPVLVPFPSVGATIATVEATTPIATGVETAATRRAIIRAREKARKKRERQLDNLAEKEQNLKEIVEANIAFLLEGYKLYAKRVIPLLSNSQKKKHLDFSRHI